MCFVLRVCVLSLRLKFSLCLLLSVWFVRLCVCLLPVRVFGGVHYFLFTFACVFPFVVCMCTSGVVLWFVLSLLRSVVHLCVSCVIVVIFCFLGGSFPCIACGVVVLSFSVSCVCSGYVCLCVYACCFVCWALVHVSLRFVSDSFV